MAPVYLRSDLAEDLRVAHLIQVLRITDVDLLIGKLWRLWSIAIETTEEGKLPGATADSIDNITGMPGLAQALVEVGWLAVTDDGCEIANFDDEHHRSERRRASSSKRQAKLRQSRRGEPAAAEPEPEEPAKYQRNSAWPGFERFWQAYPKKKAKFAAWRAWQKLKVKTNLLEIIVAAVEAQKHWPEWFKEGGQFIPHPATWLNGGCWENAPSTPVQKQTNVDDDEALRRRIAAERARSREEESKRSTKRIKPPPAPPPTQTEAEPEPTATDDEPIGLIEENIEGFYEHYLADES